MTKEDIFKPLKYTLAKTSFVTKFTSYLSQKTQAINSYISRLASQYALVN